MQPSAGALLSGDGRRGAEDLDGLRWGGRDGRLVEDAVRPGKGIGEQGEVGDAPLDKRHPGVVEEVLDVHPPTGGEVVDDDDVVVLC